MIEVSTSSLTNTNGVSSHVIPSGFSCRLGDASVLEDKLSSLTSSLTDIPSGFSCRLGDASVPEDTLSSFRVTTGVIEVSTSSLTNTNGVSSHVIPSGFSCKLGDASVPPL